VKLQAALDEVGAGHWRATRGVLEEAAASLLTQDMLGTMETLEEGAGHSRATRGVAETGTLMVEGVAEEKAGTLDSQPPNWRATRGVDMLTLVDEGVEERGRLYQP
jgi:hypothetical protein